MVGVAILDKLTTVNISKNTEKTKERVDVLWKQSTKAQKEDLKKFADSKSDRAFYNVTKDGIITARKALAIAQTFNVSPFYLTADTDEVGDNGNDTLKAFVKKYTLNKQSTKAAEKKQKAAPKKARKTKEAKAAPAIASTSDVKPEAKAASSKPEAKVKTPHAKKTATPKKTSTPKNTAPVKAAKQQRVLKSTADAAPVDIADVNLTLDELKSLLSTVYIRANNGIGGAREKLDKIKALLLL